MNGKRQKFDIPFSLQGTDFQLKVWNALQKIPFGETTTYKDIAIAIGSEKSCRAAGGAIHNNPIPIIIPCHRVIGSNGSLTGFRGGIPLKQNLLKIEQPNSGRTLSANL